MLGRGITTISSINNVGTVQSRIQPSTPSMSGQPLIIQGTICSKISFWMICKMFLLLIPVEELLTLGQGGIYPVGPL
jgi:hypothetical protein